MKAILSPEATSRVLPNSETFEIYIKQLILEGNMTNIISVLEKDMPRFGFTENSGKFQFFYLFHVGINNYFVTILFLFLFFLKFFD